MSFRIYVGNLNFRTTDDGLRAAFEAFGPVTEVYIGSDRETGRSRGFGFVTMGEKAHGEAAIAALNGSQLDGRAIVVNEAQPRPPKTGGFGGGGGGGGFRGGRGGGGGYGGGGGGGFRGGRGGGYGD
jgi:RNA recognition motif-containing protein